MITATTALDQNREVFAVPGQVGLRQSRGCNALIKTGRAKLVESLDDIIAEVRLRLPSGKGTLPAARPRADLTLFEESIFAVLEDRPQHIDVVAERAKMSTSDALVHLLSLEFKGLVIQHPGKMFTLI